ESCNEQKAQRLEKSFERQNGSPPIRARIDRKPCVLNRTRGDTVTALGSRKVNRTGRSTGQRRTNRYTKIGGQFSPHVIDMLRSPYGPGASSTASKSRWRITAEPATASFRRPMMTSSDTGCIATVSGLQYERRSRSASWK